MMNDPQLMQADVAFEIDGQLMTQEQFENYHRQKVEALYGQFARMRDEWVQHRAQSGVELRWRRASTLYFGDRDDSRRESLEKTLREGPAPKNAAAALRSRVSVNIVRPKVDQAVARLCEILFPVDDRNWGIKPTPVPQLAARLGDRTPTVDPQTGQPTGATADSEAQVLLEEAKKHAEAMERSIDDSLTECGFNGESRKVIEDGVRLGCGILKGPFPTYQTSKVWKKTEDGHQMVINRDVVPASARRDPWDIFFDPACGNDHQRGRGVWERRMVTRKELRALNGLPGYDAEAIRQVLRESPRRIRVAEQRVNREVIKEDAYELWEYHGEIEPSEMECLSRNTGDPLEDVSFGVLVMVNDKVIGALDSWAIDGLLPYDVWCWRKADDSPYGYGLPDELEDQQRVVTSAWRMVMDNGRNSLGGQIVMRQGAVIPQDGQWTITPNKLWLAKNDTEDVNKAFGTFEFNSHLEELLAIAKTAMEFADMESSMPQILGGNALNGAGSGAPETLGGMVMMFNNASAVLRQRVKLYDDNITRPHISRYYDWKMCNDPDDSIKGDYEVDARGSTALIERDIQNQALLNLANVTNNPRYAPHLKERNEIKAILKAFRMDPEDLMKTEEEVQREAEAAAQNPPQDPKVLSAQMDMQMKQMDLEDKERQRQFESQRNEKELAFRHQNLVYNAMREQSEAEQASVDAQLQREIAIAKMQQDGQMSREEMERKERLELIKITDGRERFNAEAALRIRTGQGI
jgi:hypothetical protein